MEKIKNQIITKIKFNKIMKLHNEVEFYECTFTERIINTKAKDKKMKFQLCTFDKHTVFTKELTDLTIIKCTFNDMVDFINIPKIEFLKIVYSIFNEVVSFRELNINEFRSNMNHFSRSVFFQKITFNIIDLKSTSYNDKIEFHDIINLNNKELEIENLSNRETARIIKDSFEQQNNIIEANKYYAIEMQKREDELSWKDNFLEKLVFKAHGLTSNHSQDWFLASLWVILFGMLLTVFKSDFSFGIKTFLCLVPFLYISMNKYMFIVFYSLYFLFMNSINKHPLDDFASNINPFSIMTSADKLTFTELVFKIIIAFLIYQLIVSIRQNTRRK